MRADAAGAGGRASSEPAASQHPPGARSQHARRSRCRPAGMPVWGGLRRSGALAGAGSDEPAGIAGKSPARGKNRASRMPSGAGNLRATASASRRRQRVRRFPRSEACRQVSGSGPRAEARPVDIRNPRFLTHPTRPADFPAPAAPAAPRTRRVPYPHPAPAPAAPTPLPTSGAAGVLGRLRATRCRPRRRRRACRRRGRWSARCPCCCLRSGCCRRCRSARPSCCPRRTGRG
jgi:hypothetical protein